MAASYIPVPRDLTKVKSKVMFNLTKRQLSCFSIAAIMGVPTFFLLKTIGSISMAAMGMMVVMMPLFFLAMYEKNGQPLEVYLNQFIQANFVRPKYRPYETDNHYAAILRHIEAQKEVERIVFHSEKKAKGKRPAGTAKVAQQKGAKAGRADHRGRKEK
jgi:hypothetical protein